MRAGRTAKSKAGSPSAFQRLQDQLKWVDLIFEVCDARAPSASRHPNSDKLFGRKPRVVVLAKADLAAPAETRQWEASLSKADEQRAFGLTLKEQKGKGQIIAAALALTAARRQELMKKGLLDRPMRAIVVGMPNVGKSSFINWLIGRRKALTGDKPGVTRGTQWVRVHPQLELLDTPGILPPESPAEDRWIRLALLNLLPDTSYDAEQTAAIGLDLVHSLYPSCLTVYEPEAASHGLTLESIARARGCLAPGGKLDTRRAAAIFLNDLRSGNLGRLTLERP